MPPTDLSKYRGWFFYALNKHYRQNVKTKVSNARMNSPKVIKSLKPNFTRTTSILCRKEVNHPVTRLFHENSLPVVNYFFYPLLSTTFSSLNTVSLSHPQ